MTMRRSKTRKPVRTLCCAAVCALLAVMIPAAAQTGRTPSTSSSGREEFSLEEITKLEMNYNQVLTDALSFYFSKARYVIGVKIAVGTRSSEVESAVVTKKRESSDFELPALPVVPDELKMKKRDDESQQESRFRTSLIIKNITVNATIDTSFTRAEQDFFTHAIGLSINLRPQRGDRVTIVRKAFPAGNPAAASPGPGSGLLPSVRQNDLPTGLILGVLGLAVIGGVVLLLIVRRPSPSATVRPEPITVNVGAVSASAAPAADLPGVASGTTVLSHTPGMDDREFLYRAFAEHPHVVGRYMAEKVRAEGEHGTMELAVALYAADDKLLRLYVTECTAEVYGRIELAIQSLTKESVNRNAAMLTTVRREIEDRIHTQDRGHSVLQFPGFGFLQRLDGPQVESLYSMVTDPSVRALLLSQLPFDRARTIVQGSAPEESAEILARIPAVRTADRDWLRRWEEELFTLSMRLLQRDHERKDEFTTALNILQMLPIDRQRVFIEELQRTRPELGEQLSAVMVHFDELDRLDTALLTSYLTGVSTDTIARAVAGAPPAAAEALLRTRLPRERAMIEQGITRSHRPSSAETEAAQHAIVTAILLARRRDV